MKRLKFYSCLVILLFFSCSKDTSIVSPIVMSENAKSYLNSALDIMQENSINRYKINWENFRKIAFANAGNAQTAKDTYDAIRNALINLGDNHSFFVQPTINPGKLRTKNIPLYTAADKLEIKASDPIGKRITHNIGFIRIPAFSGSGQAATNFANEIQDLIRKIDSTSIKGWIVDIRQNMGGNMWPMLASIGPVLGEGLVGKFVDPDNNTSNWYYEKGVSRNDDWIAVQVNNYYSLKNPNPAVAVLTDGKTASSGEAIAVAFRGRDKTRSIGDYTFGVSTANAGFTLSDGAIIYLTVSTMADRNGILYGGKIKPDEIIAAPFQIDPAINDSVAGAAIKWLNSNL